MFCELGPLGDSSPTSLLFVDGVLSWPHGELETLLTRQALSRFARHFQNICYFSQLLKFFLLHLIKIREHSDKVRAITTKTGAL